MGALISKSLEISSEGNINKKPVSIYLDTGFFYILPLASQGKKPSRNRSVAGIK